MEISSSWRRSVGSMPSSHVIGSELVSIWPSMDPYRWPVLSQGSPWRRVQVRAAGTSRVRRAGPGHETRQLKAEGLSGTWPSNLVTTLGEVLKMVREVLCPEQLFFFLCRWRCLSYWVHVKQSDCLDLY